MQIKHIVIKKILFLLYLVILAFVECNALDFKKGYVITLNNDTIYGEIANNNYYEHSIICTFKDPKKLETTTYFPNQLIGYRFVDGKYYISKRIMVDSIHTSYFMEYLINGNLSLFLRQDKGLINRFYVEKDTSGIRELIYNNEIIHKVDSITHESGSFEVKKKKYIGLLSYLTYDCPELQKDIPLLNEPDQQKLINFAKKYHNLTCSDKECTIYEKKMPLKFKVEAYTSTDFFIIGDLNSYQNPLQSFGFNTLFSNSKISERAYIGLGFLISPIINNVPALVPLRIPLSINYINPKKGFSPLFSAAFDLNSLGGFQIYSSGVKYQVKNISLNLTAELLTGLSIIPYGIGIKFGLMYDL